MKIIGCIRIKLGLNKISDTHIVSKNIKNIMYNVKYSRLSSIYTTGGERT